MSTIEIQLEESLTECGGRPWSVDADACKAIRERFEDGDTTQQIADDLGIEEWTASHHAEGECTHGDDGKPMYVTREESKEMQERHDGGEESLRQIAEDLGRDERTVARHARGDSLYGWLIEPSEVDQ